MRNLNESSECAENKLELIKEILQMDCELINKAGFLSPEFNYKLTDKQVQCMNVKVNKILELTNLTDFKVNSMAFKNLKFSYDYIHFQFIDKNSVHKFPGLSVENVGHDLYYIMITCNSLDLYTFDFADYEAFIVNDQYIPLPIELSPEIYSEIRNEFLGGIGNVIRKNSTLNAITEYITFTKDKVSVFMGSLSEDYNMRVKLICINRDCTLDGVKKEVTDYLKELKNRNKLSMAFEHDKTEFYDIGNMQP